MTRIRVLENDARDEPPNNELKVHFLGASLILSWNLEVAGPSPKQKNVPYNIDSNKTLNPVPLASWEVDVTGMCGCLPNIATNTAMLTPENVTHRGSTGGKRWMPTLLLRC